MNTIEILPDFIKNKDYKELSPLQGSYKYRFVTLKDIHIKFLHPFTSRGDKILFKDFKERVWMTLDSYDLIISKDYAWDGCTPKKWWGIWWGTPDFESTILASLVHDALIQFQNTKYSPFNRKQIDEYFKYILNKKYFIFENIYYMGVRVGSIFPNIYYNVYSELTNTHFQNK